jgi:hypothetical protein
MSTRVAQQTASAAATNVVRSMDEDAKSIASNDMSDSDTGSINDADVCSVCHGMY